MELYVKFVVVVQVDGLDEEGFVEAISKYGEVFDREDNELDEETPVRMFYIDTTFGKYVRFKLDFNCAEPQRYVLFPMASLEDKRKVEELKKAE